MPDYAGYALMFGVAAAVSAAATPLMKRVAVVVGAVARPSSDRWSQRVIPLLGGVAIYLGVVVPVLGFGPRDPVVGWVLAAGTVMMFVGLVDDFVHLKPSSKLVAQLLVACAFQVGGLHSSWTGWVVIDSPISILWVVAITNAFNLLDNMDGLCAGIGAIAALAFAACITGQAPAMALVAIALAGAAVGFLAFNSHPASIFMGDAGSLFIGVTLAGLSQAVPHRDTMGLVSAMAFPVLLLLIPLFDTLFVTLSRKLSARKASVGGRDHTSHRLVALGLSEPRAVRLLYAFAALGGATAFAVSRASFEEATLLTGVLTFGLVLLGVRLARVNVYGGEDFVLLKGQPYTPLLVDFTYKRRIFEILLDFALAGFAYYAAFVLRFSGEFRDTYYTLFATSLPVVIGCEVMGLYAAGVYRGIWRYFGVSDLGTYIKGVGLGTLFSVLSLVYLTRFEGQSRGVFAINALVFAALVVAAGLSFRALGEWSDRARASGQPALIYGAGDGGALAVRELRNNFELGYWPVAFVDDDASKQGRRINGVAVAGGYERLPMLLATTQAEAVILTTKLDPGRLRDVQAVCLEAGVVLLRLEVRLDVVMRDGRAQPVAVSVAHLAS
jgi:UDP-GlcNAc:undecaprenyl-phosphate GlcNAc-1-phosphate transferase